MIIRNGQARHAAILNREYLPAMAEEQCRTKSFDSTAEIAKLRAAHTREQCAYSSVGRVAAF